MRRSSARFLLSLLLAGSIGAAEIRVDGLGWFGSRKSARALQVLLEDSAQLDAPAIEDAALILHHQLTQQGFLEPQVLADIETPEGRTLRHPIDAMLSEPLPRPLEASRVTFEINRGQRYRIERLTFHGLESLDEEEARQFFVGETMLLRRATDRVYSPAGLRSSASNLADELRLRGHADAKVEAVAREVDTQTGAATVEVTVDEGPVWRVVELDYEITDGSEPPPDDLRFSRLHRPWSGLWRQDTTTAIRRWYFQRGHPDVRVQLTGAAGPVENNSRPVSVTARITPGPQIRLGEIRVIGNEHTRESALLRTVRVEKGDLLNPIQLDNSQARLARLGVFSRVDVRYVPAGDGVRDAEFVVREGRRQEVNLLAGYGSYEQLRGGVEWRHYNLLGRAHTTNLRLVQSMKSTRGDYRYTVPELFGTAIDGSARIFALRREELAFVRAEHGVNVSLARPIRPLRANASVSYSYRRLRSTSSDLASQPTDSPETVVASLDFRLTQDRRDSPLTPRRGHRVHLQVEEASKALGGEVDYQQFTIGASYHTSWGRGRWLHVGFEHGLVTTLGSKDDVALPVNVRFFPGGDGSIRGYRSGEAAPRAANGQFIGAKSYLQLSVELEQAITPKLSAVLFSDNLGTAVELADYPFDGTLHSVGLGLRYHTLIGPLRLEYGYNLNRRAFDPSGSILISVGVPF